MQPLIVICFCKERTHLFMVLDQFCTLVQDCGILCLHQLETHNLSQYFDYKLKLYSFHTAWKTDASTQLNLLCHLQGIDFQDSLFPALGLVVGVGCLSWVSWPFCCRWPALHLSPGHDGDQNCGFPVGDADVLAVNFWYHISRNLH